MCHLRHARDEGGARGPAARRRCAGSALDEWWDATDVDNNGQIDRAEYLELGKALYRVMIRSSQKFKISKSENLKIDASSSPKVEKTSAEIMSAQKLHFS